MTTPNSEENKVTAEGLRAALASGTLLADGGMGTALLAKRPLKNRCLDELNLSLPAIVRDVHREFLHAGAEILTTNTFGANRVRLGEFGFGDKVRAVNLAGVRIAREAARGAAYVAGAVGPLGVAIEPLGEMSAEEARAIFREQMDALVAAGVDLLMLETFQDLNELREAVAAAWESAGPAMVIVANVSVEDDGSLADGTEPEVFARRMDEWAVHAIGVNCSTGPRAVLRAIERMSGWTKKPLCAMPNAGRANAVTPEYMARYAARFLRAGARIVGGCCGVGPEHIRAMAEEVRGWAFEVVERDMRVEEQSAPAEMAPVPMAEKSGLAKKLSSGKFVTLYEFVPAAGPNAAATMLLAHAAKYAAVDGVSVVEGKSWVSAAVTFTLLEREGVPTVLALNAPKPGPFGSAMLGSAVEATFAAGVRNVVCESSGAVYLARRHAEMLTGIRVNPAAADLDAELRRFERAVKAGAEFAVTRPMYDVERLEEFLTRAKEFGVPVIVGIRPLRGVVDAEYMIHELGVAVPEDVVAKLGEGDGMGMAREMAERARGIAAGVEWSGMELTELH